MELKTCISSLNDRSCSGTWKHMEIQLCSLHQRWRNILHPISCCNIPHGNSIKHPSKAGVHVLGIDTDHLFCCDILSGYCGLGCGLSWIKHRLQLGIRCSALFHKCSWRKLKPIQHNKLPYSDNNIRGAGMAVCMVHFTQGPQRRNRKGVKDTHSTAISIDGIHNHICIDTSWSMDWNSCTPESGLEHALEHQHLACGILTNNILIEHGRINFTYICKLSS